MPRVPVYESKVRTKPIDAPMVRATDENIGAIGEGLAKAGDVLSSIAEKEIDQQRDLMANNAVLEWEKEKTATLHDKESGLYTFSGEAVYTPDKDGKSRDMAAKERLRAKADMLVGALPDGARERAKAVLEQRIVSTDRDIDGFSGKAIEEAKTSSVKAGISALEKSIEAGESVSDADIAARLSPMKKFIPSEDAFNAISDGLKAKRAIADISTFLDAEDPENALLMIEKNKHLIGDDAIKYTSVAKKMISRREIIESVRTTTDKSIYKSPNGELVAGWIDESAARRNWAVARRNVKPGDLNDADSAFEHEMTANAKLREANIASVVENASGAFAARHKTDDIDHNDRHFLEEHAGDQWKKFRNAEDAWLKSRRAEARSIESARRAAGGATVDRNPDMIAKSELNDAINRDPELYATMTPEQFSNEWRARLGTEAKNGFKLFDTHRTRFDREPNYQNSSKGYARILNGALTNYDAAPGSKRSKEKRAELEAELNSVINDRKASGVPVDDKEMQAIVDRYVMADLGKPYEPRRVAPASPAAPVGRTKGRTRKVMRDGKEVVIQEWIMPDGPPKYEEIK